VQSTRLLHLLSALHMSCRHTDTATAGVKTHACVLCCWRRTLRRLRTRLRAPAHIAVAMAVAKLAVWWAEGGFGGGGWLGGRRWAV